MSNIFNIKRAASYFVHDLRTAKNNYLYSMLILGLLPIISFVIWELLVFIFNKGQFSDVDSSFQTAMFVISIATLIITFPIKQYGRLTDRRYGSDWLMLPASTFEKWLSIIVLTCVALPVVFFALYLGSDWLLSVIFPNRYPEALLSSGMLSNMFTSSSSDFYEEAGVSINFLGASYASWVQNILLITLGAVIFKKAKFPKTLLAWTGLMMFIVFVIMMFNGFDININEDDLENWLGGGDVEVFARRLNTFVTFIYLVFFILIGGGLYLRLKTIKH